MPISADIKPPPKAKGRNLLRDSALSYPNSRRPGFGPGSQPCCSAVSRTPRAEPATSWSFGSHLLQEHPSPPPVFGLLNPVARLPLPEVGLVAKAPAGLISALFLEDFSSVGFDISPNSLLRKGLKQISCVEIASDLWIAKTACAKAHTQPPSRSLLTPHWLRIALGNPTTAAQREVRLTLSSIIFCGGRWPIVASRELSPMRRTNCHCHSFLDRPHGKTFLV